MVWRDLERAIEQVQVVDVWGDDYYEDDSSGFWEELFPKYAFDVLKMPHDEAPRLGPSNLKKKLRDIILSGEAHEVNTLLEFMLRDENIPEPLSDGIKRNLGELSLYWVDESASPVCIMQATSEENKKAVERSLKNINNSEFDGSKTHLRKASEALDGGNFADSVRESIHAVESAAKKISGQSSKTLRSALGLLEKEELLRHKALKEAFNKLYAFTNDEQGIRHALVDEGSADVGFDEAIFMYSACVAFVDYLISKQKIRKQKRPEGNAGA